MTAPSPLLFFRVAILISAVVSGVAGCARVGPERASSPDTGGGSPDAPTSAVDGSPAQDSAPEQGPCFNLECQRTTCAGGGTTSISGTAFAPNGKLPLFNVSVYIPNSPLEPLAEGVVCDRCGGAASAAKRAVVSTLSNEKGNFKLTNVPAGKDIPLVFQVGKWRRQVTIANVTACQDNPLTDPNLTRLPRNRGDGNMPRIAVTTGRCDGLGCLLPKIGIDPDELGVAGQGRSVTYFRGDGVPMNGPAASWVGPENSTPAENLWGSEDELKKYDLVLFSCECGEYEMSKGPTAYEAVTKYLAQGGRIFGSDFMYVWYKFSMDPRLHAALDIKGGAPRAQNPMVLDTGFPKGKALADWMMIIDPTTRYGQLSAQTVYANLNSAMPDTAQVWATSPGPEGSVGNGPRIVTINTPAGAPKEQQCGRAVHLDAHIGDTLSMGRGGPYPAICAPTLNKGEEALAFLFFDLAACIQSDRDPIVVP